MPQSNTYFRGKKALSSLVRLSPFVRILYSPLPLSLSRTRGRRRHSGLISLVLKRGRPDRDYFPLSSLKLFSLVARVSS